MTRRRGRPGKRERVKRREHVAQGARDERRFVGELRLHRDGYGFVIADRPGVEDVFVPARFIGDALHTDLVEIVVVPGRGDKREGRVVGILERRVTRLVGRLENVGKGYRVVASDQRIRRQVMVDPKQTGGAHHGDEVIVAITDYPAGDSPMRGVVEKVIEGRGQLDAEEEVIITHHQFPTRFSDAALGEADRLARREPVVVADRCDLTDIAFITIDGESAKDFDDAVAVRRLDDGSIRLWVSIADVSHYVQPGSCLDAEAYARGTSVYFPQRCLPMLPEALSNDLCSLRPDVVRYTMTAQLDIDSHGMVVAEQFYSSCIRSRRRMTYTEIRRILVDRDETVLGAHNELVGDIRLMEECYGRLRRQRRERGSLDFDLPEPEIVMDIEGGIDAIVRAERHVGHMMIEEFMVAANEAVARALARAGRGCIYRVHESPSSEKLRAFALFMHNIGIDVRLPDRVQPKQLARVIEKVKGRPEERVVNHKLLRSMAQAVYSPENLGHYGLASACYCHFTSPIRRYPDLVVHRLLARFLPLEGGGIKGGGDHGVKVKKHHPHPSSPLKGEVVQRYSSASLGDIAQHCSRRERVAMEAERQMAKLYAALFMRDRLGERFAGVVSHVASFGFFVELEEFFVEGVVRLEDLPDGGYRLDEAGMKLVGRRGRHSIRIGDRVVVHISDVRIADKEIVLELVEH